MSDKPDIFGSYGLQSPMAMFGQRNSKTRGKALEISAPVFGKRKQSPGQSLSLKKARLSFLRAELVVLFEDKAFPEEPLPFALDVDGDTPRLLVGESAVVVIDSETGYLVFQEQGAHSGLIVATPSEERLIDHVVCHLAAREKISGSETANKAAQMLVGQSLADVERRVILQTLRHCHGNRTRTAEMLGISLRTVRNKLREYLRPLGPEELRQ